MLQSLKKYFKKNPMSGFAVNLGKLMSGTGFAHLIGVAIIPVLTRLFTPEEIGMYATYLSLLTILCSIASLRYEYATLIPRTDQEANNITALSSILVTGFSLLLLVVLLIATGPITRLLGVGTLGWLIYLLPFSIFSFGMFMILLYRLNREKRYSAMAAGKITGTGVMSAGQITMGWLQLQQAGLILGKVAGDVSGMILLLWRTSKIERSVRSGVSRKRMMAMAKRYRNFPFWNAPHALTTTISNNIPVLLFYNFFSEAVAGYYAMAVKALYSPVQVIAQAAFQVFGQRIAEKRASRERLIPFINSTLLLLGGIGIVPFLLLFLFSPPLFDWFLGTGFETTGYYVRILTPFVFLAFLVTPLNFIPLMLNRQRKAFVIDLVYLAIRVAALATGIWYQSVEVALILYSISGVCINTYLLFWFYHIARKAEMESFLSPGRPK